ncbi:hypothetical protein Pelo_3752 [Pelomyxa schiedti]|nr:hypothetical protein Pelo_3752 [Pelomyxa schiedti]
MWSIGDFEAQGGLYRPLDCTGICYCDGELDAFVFEWECGPRRWLGRGVTNTSNMRKYIVLEIPMEHKSVGFLSNSKFYEAYGFLITAKREETKKPIVFIPDVPSDILCPVSQDILHDPVFLHGNVFSRVPITEWLTRHHRDPFTGREASVFDLTPANSIKRQLCELKWVRESSICKLGTKRTITGSQAHNIVCTASIHTDTNVYQTGGRRFTPRT